MSQQGALPPPPGVVPNFVNPSGGVHFWLKFAQFVCIPIITVFVALRMYAKIFMLHEFYLEDCKLVLRLAVYGACACVCVCVCVCVWAFANVCRVTLLGLCLISWVQIRCRSCFVSRALTDC